MSLAPHSRPVIRAFSPADRGCIEKILRASEAFNTSDIAVALELVDDAIQHPNSSDYWIRIAVLDGEVAGYICFGPTPMTVSTYDLYWIVTSPMYRGQGIARTLIETMEGFLLQRHSAANVRVETSQSEGYQAAQALYRRMGYPEIGRFCDFYKPGDDLIVYFKALRNQTM